MLGNLCCIKQALAKLKNLMEKSCTNKPKSHASSPKKYAVLVGCNYPNTERELYGCVNDALRMEKTLLSRFGFSKENIDILIDTDSKQKQPTGKNIRDALELLVKKACPGDILYFQYSGHGTRIVRAGDETGYDECIIPCDANLIKDDDFREIVNKVPDGATFIVVSDSCHSGGLIDKEKEQIGPVLPLQSTQGKTSSTAKLKYLPPENILETLKEKTGNKNLNFSTMNDALIEAFGEKASLSTKKSHINEQKHKEISSTDKKEKEKECVCKVKVNSDVGILLSGCQSDENSEDACPNGILAESFGAFSDSIQRVLASHPKPITYKDLLLQCRELLAKDKYQQHPCLYCSDSNVNRFFLCEASKK